MSIAKLCALSVGLIALAGCASETHRAILSEKPATAAIALRYQGAKRTLVIGKLQNRSSYMNGIFSDGVDHLGAQAKTILMAHLQQTNRFELVDRDNLAELSREAQYSGDSQHIAGANFTVTGAVTEFGRKEVGDQQLFGILGAGKSQIAYAKVTLNVIDVKTSKVVYAAQGGGEYALSQREVIGFGSTASYDATLNGKVLDLAMREVVDRLVEGLEQGAGAQP